MPVEYAVKYAPSPLLHATAKEISDSAVGVRYIFSMTE